MEVFKQKEVKPTTMLWDNPLSPQKYLEAVTGKCYIIKGDDDEHFINVMLEEHGLDFKSYPEDTNITKVKQGFDYIRVECLDLIRNRKYNRWYPLVDA